MKRLLTLTLVCLALGTAVDATEESQGPRIRVDPTIFDFGKVRPGKALRREFRVRNLGDEPLVIERISRSCRCTSAETDASTLEVGASTPLRVGLETPRTPGPVEETVLIRSNDPKTPLLEIRLQATVVEE